MGMGVIQATVVYIMYTCFGAPWSSAVLTHSETHVRKQQTSMMEAVPGIDALDGVLKLAYEPHPCEQLRHRASFSLAEAEPSGP